MSGFRDHGRGGGRGGRGDTSGRPAGGRGFGGDQGRGRGDGGGRGGGGGYGGGGGGGGRDGGGGYGGGGRGGVGGGGGRGGDGGRGGRGGGNPHIGESPPILALGSHTGMNDAAIRAVVCPPASERNRAALTANPYRPGHHRDRAGAAIGAQVPSAGGAIVVTTNHFSVNAASSPSTITHYHVHLYRVGRDGQNRSEVVASLEDVRKTVQVMKTLCDKHPEWRDPPVGFAYDTKSALFTTRALGFCEVNTDRQPFYSEVVGLPNSDGTESTVLRYRVILTEVARNVLGLDRLRAQEIAVLMYGRWDVVLDRPQWNVVNNCIYAGSDALSETVKPFRDAGQLLAKQGWYASLKSCAVGPMLTVDLACSAFLASGSMVELMAKAAGYRDVNEFLRCFGPGGRCTLQPRQLENIDRSIAKAKVKVTHLGFWKVVRHLGPSASSKESAFEHEGKKYTVAEYYALKAKTDKRYKPLKYPHLPTVNMGSAAKKELYPIELVDVPSGQARNRMLTEIPQLGGEMIRHAAVKPAERMRHIVENGQSVVQMLRSDETARAFGLDSISAAPATVPATVLPPAKLQYGAGQVMEPGMKGTWSADFPKKVPFYRPPPNPTAGTYRYGVLLISGGRKPRDGWENILADFCASLENDSIAVGAKLTALKPHEVCHGEAPLIQNALKKLRSNGAQIVLVVMFADNAYGTIKLVSDGLGLPTQCIKWEKVEKSPRGIHFNVLLKINFKLGGTSHVLKSRLAGPPGAAAAAAPGTFQSPPASLSWIFDRPCMLVGIDVSHPEPGIQRESMAAVVGSIDGSATKYVAHISAQTGRQEMVAALTEAMGSLLASFRGRNKGAMPETLVVYRDGVSEGQYDQVLQQELPQIQEAIALQGFTADRVRIAVVVCTKGHRTRIVCQDGPGGEYVNPCPGLVVDSIVTSENLNEFYLNSHAAIQGTAKPCRYTVLYDEVGFKMSELQLLTYWTTYLYARCNKSVSYATPAYYAHWASKRGKELLAAGATRDDLRDICATCATPATAPGHRDNNMFFL